MKKTILIIIGIIVLIGVSYFLIQNLNNKDTSSTTTNNDIQNTTTVSNLFTAPASETPAIYSWIRNGTLYFVSTEGKIIKTLINGGEQVLSAGNISSIVSAQSSNDGVRIIVGFGEFSNLQFSIFNVTNNTWTPLPIGVYSATFSPNGKEVAYLKDENDATSIIISSVDLKNTRRIMSLHILDVNISWPNSGTLILTEKPSASIIGTAWSINISNKTLNKVTSGAGLLFKVSQNGNLYYSLTNASERTLSFSKNVNANLYATIPFITLPDKCYVGQEKIYCAIPQNLSGNIILPDDYLKKSFYSSDSFIEYDIETGISNPILGDAFRKFDAVNITVNKNKIYFINRYDNLIYSLDL